MNRRAMGVTFCFIAAFLFSMRYIAAAIYIAGGPSWDRNIFEGGLTYVGNELLYLSVLSLLVGVFYILREELKEKNANQDKGHDTKEMKNPL